MDQMASFNRFPHIGEKVFGYLTEENVFKSGFSVCKSWNEILKNPLFWLKKLKKLKQTDEYMQKWMNSVLECIDFKDFKDAYWKIPINLCKELNKSNEDMQKWMNSTLEMINLNFASRELSRSFQKKMFCLKKLKNPALEWKGFSDANIELAKSLRRKYFFIEENTKYVCNTCKIGFPTPAILNCHQKIHLVQHNFRSIIYFYCADCKIGWRIHRHLAKHLRSKSHIMKLENVGKLPIGTYDKLEHSETDFNLIDTSSCESSLESLKTLAAAL